MSRRNGRHGKARRTPPCAARVAAALAILLAGGCGEGPAGPASPLDELDVREESAHGFYFHAPGDSVDVQAQEAYYVWLLDRLGISPGRQLVYLKYRNRSHMQRMTGARANGWAEVGTYRFHTIWPVDDHECVHALVSSEWGTGPALMNEGMAVAHQVPVRTGGTDPVWSGTPIDSIAARALRNGTLPPLAELLHGPDFRRYEESLSYPVAGSFVKSVIERHGYRAMEAFFRSSHFEHSPQRLRSTFQDAFGESIEQAWAAWLASLQ